MPLARISHKLSTAAAQRTMSTALRSLRLLDVLFKYACGVFSRVPCIHGPLNCLATKPREKYGLQNNNPRGIEGLPPTSPLAFTEAAPARQLQFGMRFTFSIFVCLVWQHLEPATVGEHDSHN